MSADRRSQTAATAESGISYVARYSSTRKGTQQFPERRKRAGDVQSRPSIVLQALRVCAAVRQPPGTGGDRRQRTTSTKSLRLALNSRSFSSTISNNARGKR